MTLEDGLKLEVAADRPDLPHRRRPRRAHAPSPRSASRSTRADNVAEPHASKTSATAPTSTRSDGQKVGKLHAIVLDPRDNQVTHLAVNTGPHFPEPGFGDPKIVSVDIEQPARRRRRIASTSPSPRPPSASCRSTSTTHFFAVPEPSSRPRRPAARRLWNAGVAVAAALASLGTGIAVPAEHFARRQLRAPHPERRPRLASRAEHRTSATSSAC